jgi:ATP-binding cassette, subfamily B, bacterial
MIGGPGLGRPRLRLDDSITRQQVKPGAVRRILPYARQYRWHLAFLLTITAVDAGVNVANPLLFGMIIDNAIIPRHLTVLIELTLAIAGLAVVDTLATYAQTRSSAYIGQGLVFNLRTQVFSHVQRQPLAFFTRSQTGSLVSRLNGDVIGAQQALTTLLSLTLSTILTLILTLIALFYLSWQITVVTVILLPAFFLPGRIVGKRLQRLTRQQMQLDAELGSMMNERFNVAGAMLAKLYGRPDTESGLFARLAARLRDVSILTGIYARAFVLILSLVAALITALVYGLGGAFVINGDIKLGTLVAIAALIARLYGPITQLSNLQVNVLTALVSFDRVFEVLDLKPLIAERPEAAALTTRGPGDKTAPGIEFDQVCFQYPAASEISLASLESVSLPVPERDGREWILRDVSFHAAAGKLTALVGPSGAGKTTITHLVPRLYDPNTGTVRIGGQDVRDVTLGSLHDAVGVVTQDAHLFHDTIRANLMYARPDITEREMVEACQAARIWELISALPDGLDTVAGDRGYRFSGGEKQRLALARLLLKAPSVVVLDEATAHLDSESEAAIQQALRTALTGRTSLVIAHRLSTIREADQILVISEGQVRERGTHDELLVADGLYAELYRTQFARQSTSNGRAGSGDPPDRIVVPPSSGSSRELKPGLSPPFV